MSASPVSTEVTTKHTPPENLPTPAARASTVRRWSRKPPTKTPPEDKPRRAPTMWGEQLIVTRPHRRSSLTDSIERARALRAARAIHRNYQPAPKLLESLLSLAGKPTAPRWAKLAIERFKGGAESNGSHVRG